MKVVHVMYQINIGGIESMVMNIFREMRHDVHFVFLTYKQDKFDFEDEVNKLGGKIIRISPPQAGNRVRHIKELVEVFNNEKPDVVHCHTYFDSASVLYAAKKAGVRERIAHSHTTESFNIYRSIIHSVMRLGINRNATKKLACSKEAGESLFGKKTEFEIVRNGIDTNKYSFNKQKRAAIRKRLRIKGNEVVVGHIGRIVDVKNHKMMVEIANSLREKNYRFRMLFIGDGEERNNIKKMVDEKGLNLEIQFLGNQTRAGDYLSAFDVFLLPSKYEGLSIALIEAELNGLPAVVSESIPSEAIIGDNVEKASIFESPDKWADLIIRLDKQRRLPDRKKVNEYSLGELVEKMRYIYGIKSDEDTISIIIPTYNASNCISRCIKSVLSQTYKNIEVIIVDDGSNDETRTIVKEYIRRDSRIKLITQRNSGPSVARINGVKSATGSYVMFVDSDDYISEETAEKIISGFTSKRVDSVRYCGISFPGGKKIGNIKGEKVIIEKDEKMKYLLFSDYFSALWLQAFKRELFDGIAMPRKKLAYCEDYLLSFMLHKNIESTLFIDENLYYYCDNNSSTTRTDSALRLCENIKDRVEVSAIMTKYVLHDYCDYDSMEKESFATYQIDRIRRDFIKLICRSNIQKKDFLEFANEVFISKNFKFIQKSIKTGGIERYVKKMPIMNKIRNGRIIKAIYQGDAEKVWLYARLRKKSGRR